jgi:hypothetical protein
MIASRVICHCAPPEKILMGSVPRSIVPSHPHANNPHRIA